MVAVGHAGVTAAILYAHSSGPLKNRHAQALAEEATANGMQLIKTETIGYMENSLLGMMIILLLPV
ncbi:MAG TPA: hypothetical protein VGE12_14620 [Noviherbaspirillum sp.]